MKMKRFSKIHSCIATGNYRWHYQHFTIDCYRLFWKNYVLTTNNGVDDRQFSTSTLECQQHSSTFRCIHASCGNLINEKFRFCRFLLYTCILVYRVLDAANMLHSLENEAASFGLKINTGKTKSKSIVNSSTTRQPRPNAIVLNGHPVEEVNQFTYLCSEICKDGVSDADVYVVQSQEG